MKDADTDPIAAFATAAEEYCDWAEAAPADAWAEAHRARQLLMELLRRAIELPDVFSEVPETTGVGDEEYRRTYERFGALPFNFYSECFDPLIVPAETPVIADLADDLADIWRDVKGGLMLWYAEATHGAAWHWRFHFESHWGHHATAAVYALQAWFSQHIDDSEDASAAT